MNRINSQILYLHKKIRHMKKSLLKCIFATVIFNLNLSAQVQMNSSGSYSENFDALLNTGSVNQWTDNSTIPNVFSQRTTASTLYTAGNGSSSTGGLYSFGATGSTERALGTIGSANTSFGGDFAHGISLQNVSGNVLPTITVSYTLEQWRNGGNTTPNTITFWYKISTTPITLLNPGVNTGWTAVPALDAASPVNTATGGLLDGNLPANRVSVAAITIPGLVLANGSYIMLKWSDPNHAGTDHGLAIDDLIVSWSNTCLNPQTYYQDSDGDGFGNADSALVSCFTPNGYTLNNTDCNDTDSTLSSISIWYADADGDGFGDISTFTFNCGQPAGFVSDSTDCNDQNSTANTISIWYADGDGDGFGNISAFTFNCGQPAGFVSDSSDCNDNNPTLSTASVWFLDADNDGYGNADSLVMNCGQPSGYVADSTDCDDLNALIFPGATEVFDSLDNNCDGNIDEGFVLNTYYLDSDLDGFGGSLSVQATSSPGPNFVAITGDCDDANASIYPNAPELCDNLDNDCDGFPDDSLTLYTSYLDFDLDGFGNTDSVTTGCLIPNGYVLLQGDCNDGDSTVFPGALEIVNNGIDEDCNGVDSINTIGITEQNFQSLFSLFPNPGRDLVNIKLSEKINGNSFIEIRSLEGKVLSVKLIDLNTSDFVIETDKFESGIYLIQLISPEHRRTRIWIKE